MENFCKNCNRQYANEKTYSIHVQKFHSKKEETVETTKKEIIKEETAKKETVEPKTAKEKTVKGKTIVPEIVKLKETKQNNKKIVKNKKKEIDVSDTIKMKVVSDDEDEFDKEFKDFDKEFEIKNIIVQKLSFIFF